MLGMVWVFLIFKFLKIKEFFLDSVECFIDFCVIFDKLYCSKFKLKCMDMIGLDENMNSYR